MIMSSLDLATLLIRIDADISGATEGFNQVGEASSSAANNSSKDWELMGVKLKSIGESLTRNLTQPIVSCFKTCLEAAGDFTETLSKTEVVFGAMSDSIIDWSSNSVESMGVAQSTALEMVSLYGDMATGMGIAGNAAADMSMNMAQLAADLASFKNISVEQASKALQGIFTGESESLKQLGVIMTEATLQEYALAQGIDKKVSAMSQSEKVMLRYQYVMQATANAQGDFSRTSDSLSNQQKKLSENLKQLWTSIGSIIEPIVTRIISAINRLITWFSNLPPSIKSVAVAIAALAAAVGPVLTVLGTLITLAPTIGATMAAIALPVGGVIAAIAALGAAFLTIDKIMADSKKRHMEAAEELGHDIAAQITETTTIKIEEDSGNASEVAKARTRIARYKQDLIDAGKAEETLGGLLVFTEESRNSLTDFSKALIDMTTATDNYSSKFQTLKGEIDSLMNSAKSAIAETYSLMIIQYALTEQAAGTSKEVVAQNCETMWQGAEQAMAQVEALAQSLQESADPLLNGTRIDDWNTFVSTLWGANDAGVELGATAMTTADALTNMKYAAANGDTATYLIEAGKLTRLLGEEAAATGQTVADVMAQYATDVENGTVAQEQLGEILQQQESYHDRLAEAETLYQDALDRTGNATEAMAVATEALGETSGDMYDALVADIDAANNAAGDFYSELDVIAQSHCDKAANAHKAYQEIIMDGTAYQDWSDTTKAIYDSMLSDLTGLEVTGGNTRAAALAKANETMSALYQAQSADSVQAMKDMLTTQGIELSDAYAGMIYGNEQFWNMYAEATNNGTEQLTNEGMAQLMAALNNPDGFGEAGELNGSAFADGVQESINEETIEAEPEVNTNVDSNDIDETKWREGLEEKLDSTTIESTPDVEFNTESIEAQQTEVDSAMESLGENAATALSESLANGEISVGEVVATLTTSLVEVESTFATMGGQFATTFVNALGTGLALGGAVARQSVTAISTSIVGAISAFTTVGNSLGTALANAIATAAGKAKTQVTNIIKSITSLKASATNAGRSIGKAVCDGISQGISSGSGAVLAKARALAASIAAIMRSALAINSPSKVIAKDVGSPIMEGIEYGMDKRYPETLKNVKEKMKGIVSSATPQMDYKGSGVVNNIGKQGNTVINQTNNFTSKTLTPYEQQRQITRLNKELAASFA